MPTYVYKCSACGHEFEIIQAAYVPALEHCPRCKGALTRVPQPAAVVLRGDGWAKDGYTKQKEASNV